MNIVIATVYCRLGCGTQAMACLRLSISYLRELPDLHNFLKLIVPIFPILGSINIKYNVYLKPACIDP